MAQRDTDELRRMAEAIVGPAGVLAGDDARARICDPFFRTPTQAQLIVRPADTRELAAVVRACAKLGQPLVTHGGLTGVAGGACSREGDIVISLERMRQIEKIDRDAQLAVVQGGVPLAALQAAAAEQGLMYPVDLLSQGTATVGGSISTNAGGNHVIRWGMTRNQVRGLEVVLPDGSVLDAMNRLLKNNSGYDLKQLFIGGEGTLGIVTRAVLQLVPAPTTQSVTLIAVESYEQVIQVLVRARRLPILSAFEVMWCDYYTLVAGSGTDRAPLGREHAYYILIETLGYAPDFDEPLVARFQEELVRAGLVAEAVVAASDRERTALWRVREGGEVIVSKMSPFLSFDISVDLRRTAACVETIRAALHKEFSNARMVTFGHLGDNNIHLAVTIGADTLSRATLIENCVYRELARFGGSISAEHGIGQDKREFLHWCKTPGEVAMMRRLKDSIDPSGLLNPDVLFERKPP